MGKPMLLAEMAMSNKNKFTQTEILVVIGMIAILAAMCIHYISNGREKSRITKCKGNMKITALTFQSYYSDGTTQDFGSIAKNNILRTGTEWGLDGNGLSCPARKSSGRETAYVFDRNSGNMSSFVLPSGVETPFTAKDTWAVVNNPQSPIFHDKGSPHRVNGKTNVACGDGHVEEK